MQNRNNLRKDSQRKRQRIINTATKLFLELGYEATSMNKLVDHLGGSKSSIYKHFKNKEALFIAVMDDMVRDHLAPILNNLKFQSCTLRDSLLSLANSTLDVLTSNKGLGIARIVFAESLRFPHLGEIYYSHGPNKAFHILSKHLVERSKSEGFICQRPDEAAEYFWAMLLHTVMLKGYCGVLTNFGLRKRRAYAKLIVDDFIDKFVVYEKISVR